MLEEYSICIAEIRKELKETKEKSPLISAAENQ